MLKQVMPRQGLTPSRSGQHRAHISHRAFQLKHGATQATQAYDQTYSVVTASYIALETEVITHHKIYSTDTHNTTRTVAVTVYPLPTTYSQTPL